MSFWRASHYDDVEPLLQQQYEEEEAEKNDALIDQVWAPIPIHGKNQNPIKTESKGSKSSTNPLRHCMNHSTIASANSLFYRRKRAIIVIIVIFLCFLYINYQPTEHIPVIHNSHVPGMKALKHFTPGPTAEQGKLSTVAIIMKMEKTTRSARSTKATRNDENETTTMPSLGSRSSNSSVTTSSSNAFTKIITPNDLNTTISINSTNLPPPPSGFLVWSDKCQIRNIDPYTPEVMQFFTRKKYEPCSTSKPLTKVVFNTTTNKYVLQINEDQVQNYRSLGGQLECCYIVIDRETTSTNPDGDISLSKCISFVNSVQLANTTDNILVECKSRNKKVYTDGYPMMPERSEIRKRLSDWNEKGYKKPISVLMIGIDSISRVNLIRAMPKTAQYLYDNEWFEMSGYNKMDDNTFPNLMAILTGYNSESAYAKCEPKKLGALDNCPFIWKTFRDLGYVTAFAEDESYINTFNYLKKGFIKPPVDYYLRPFILSAEKHLAVKKRSQLTFCLGFKQAAEYIYDYAIELATRYRNEPFFGLFWSNSFSHNDISTCSSMDEKMLEYLNRFSNQGILNESIVIFLSDHGMRFGPTRKFFSGHLEERLPFMFVWLPPSLKVSHPEFISALSVNKNRLTNPYDIHMTLKHIIELSERTPPLPHAPDCPKCQSLLRPVPHSRSCADIAIEDHWCTCIPYSSINKSAAIVKRVTKFAVNYINDFVMNFKNGSIAHKCSKLSLATIQGAYRANVDFEIYSNSTFDTYRIVFTTKPNSGMFEATIRHGLDDDVMKLTGSISRLNSFHTDSKCTQDGPAKKYCSCIVGTKSQKVALMPSG